LLTHDEHVTNAVAILKAFDLVELSAAPAGLAAPLGAPTCLQTRASASRLRAYARW
jgi:hypothetical protein